MSCLIFAGFWTGTALLFFIALITCDQLQAHQTRIKVPLLAWHGPEFPTNPVEIITQSGYPAEAHTTVTEDGYILQMYRIPPSYHRDNGKKLPVLITHGNLESSADWLMNTPKNMSLPMVLSDAGYDVWLGNHRGTPYSRYHKTIRNGSQKYWDFGIHEEGVYDFPTMIDHILAVTGKPKVHFVSLSMGTTIYCVALASKPEYNEKIGIGILMGPTVYMDNFLNGLAYYLSVYRFLFRAILKTVGPMPVLPYAIGRLVSDYFTNLCDPQVDVLQFCKNYYGLIHGPDGILTQDQFPEIMSVAPAAGSSLKISHHILQIAASKGRFPQYNYGRRKNLEIYGSPFPPEYDLSKVTAPTAVFVGLYDILGNAKDSMTLAKKLPNLVEYYEHPYERFNHVDFLYGREQAVRMYEHARELMKWFDL